MDYRRSLALVALLAGVCCARKASAQTLVGAVVDESTGFPVPGVLVSLHDPFNSRLLTDEQGRYSIRARPGRYALTLDRIGFAPLEVTVEILTNVPTRVDLKLKPKPVLLTGVVAEGKGKCGSTHDPQAAQLWYLARTALASATVASSKVFRIRKYTRVLDANSLAPEIPDHEEFSTSASWHGFQAIKLDSLLTFGFIQGHEPDLFFYGPDADVLLSSRFVELHCFRVARDKQHATMVGLFFSPSQGNRIKHDIRGTIWLDEKSGELKLVEFAYTGLPQVADQRRAGGHIEFKSLPDGSWIIPRWYLRAPRLSETLGGAKVIAVAESGGEIISIK